jgi:succinyl-CoA synthetase alpha subunit
MVSIFYNSFCGSLPVSCISKSGKFLYNIARSLSWNGMYMGYDVGIAGDDIGIYRFIGKTIVE